jgi:hypothetical protein
MRNIFFYVVGVLIVLIIGIGIYDLIFQYVEQLNVINEEITSQIPEHL